MLPLCKAQKFIWIVFKEATTYLGSISTQEGFGYQTNMGWYFLDGKIALDFSFRKETLKIIFTDPTTNSVDTFEDRSLTYVDASLVFLF